MEKQQINEIVIFLSSYSTLPIQYAVEYYFYRRFLGFKNKVWTFILSALLMTIIDYIMMKTTFEISRIITADIIWIAIISFLCYGSFLIKFYAVIVINTISVLISLTFLTFDFWALPRAHNFNMSFESHMIVNIVDIIAIDLIHIIILFLFLKSISKLLNLKEKVLNLYESLYLLIPCLAIYSFSLIFYYIQSIRIENKKYYLPYIFPKLYYALPFVSAALLMAILIVAYTFKKMLEGEEEQQENILMNQQFKLQLAHSKNIEDIYSEIRSVIHDTNNHLACLRSLAEANNMEAVKRYLHNIGKTVERLDFTIKTGNPIADAVINEKCNIARNEGIGFKCDFIMPKESLIEPMDLCIVLSNALDNAIEACRKVKDNNISKKICIKSFIRNRYLIMEISNTNIDRLHYVEGTIISTKQDKLNHGIGISNIKTAASKYNGTVDVVEENNKFVINIMFRIR
ncbi:GHKL domain-containing protein [Clostridium sp. PL3]|uniref:GHKL domain-containing protein n=1 Tax=Clostridium thailandense TaxID=2794346 RepID=A0A949TZ18_9CLOT|nr:sensor histidine kinase [Clostridium thailandense]MBV7274225.1 GHKL domain-containing protein [Clostridium thailandense]